MAMANRTTVYGPCVQFAGTVKNDIYFEEVENGDYESDCFTIAKTSFKTIKEGHYFLVAHENHLQFETRYETQMTEDCQFIISTYNDCGRTQLGCTPAMLMVSIEEKKRIIFCCEEDNKKVVKLQDHTPLTDIKGSSNEALFFLHYMKACTGCCKIESSIWRNWFLAIEAEGDSPRKLVLKEGSVGEFKFV
ncbi:hypothetical protein AAFF_G00440440 [Aldrovandia affinis]|uniref:Interleukin-18 n=1 Tax=Aldrovandia affinis TaxID=143900 RepID=A0AAD7S752_9TELE|nr:hypothetical protein AAFF_G00440440 [Aldrovandia affinis]